MKRKTLFVIGLAIAVSGCDDSPFDPDMSLDPSIAMFLQVDYMGRAAIATVFVPATQKDAYNVSVPTEHRTDFKSAVTGFLTGVAGYTMTDADALADVLLPDILTIDLTQASGPTVLQVPDERLV